MKKGRGAILIVEDNPTEQLLIQQAFEQIGVCDAIYTASDGEEAIAYLKGQGCYADRSKYRFPTFLLIDLKMPKISGFELLLFVKRCPLIVLPTIVLTMSSDPDDVKRAHLLGANAYHVKPTEMEKLCAQLKLIYDYWSSVELPEVDAEGHLKSTEEKGKLGDLMQHPVKAAQLSREFAESSGKQG